MFKEVLEEERIDQEEDHNGGGGILPNQVNLTQYQLQSQQQSQQQQQFSSFSPPLFSPTSTSSHIQTQQQLSLSSEDDDAQSQQKHKITVSTPDLPLMKLNYNSYKQTRRPLFPRYESAILTPTSSSQNECKPTNPLVSRSLLLPSTSASFGQQTQQKTEQQQMQQLNLQHDFDESEEDEQMPPSMLVMQQQPIPELFSSADDDLLRAQHHRLISNDYSGIITPAQLSQIYENHTIEEEDEFNAYSMTPNNSSCSNNNTNVGMTPLQAESDIDYFH